MRSLVIQTASLFLMCNLNVFILQNAIANLNQQYEKFESESEALTSRKKKLDKEVRRGNEDVRMELLNNDVVLGYLST